MAEPFKLPLRLAVGPTRKRLDVVSQKPRKRHVTPVQEGDTHVHLSGSGGCLWSGLAFSVPELHSIANPFWCCSLMPAASCECENFCGLSPFKPRLGGGYRVETQPVLVFPPSSLCAHPQMPQTSFALQEPKMGGN